MSSVVIAGDTSGSVTLAAPSVAGTTTLTLPATSGTVVTSATSTGINASALSTGTVPTARLASGTADSTTYLRGDQTWATVSGGVTSLNGQTGAITNTSFNAIGSYILAGSDTQGGAAGEYPIGATVAGSTLVRSTATSAPFGFSVENEIVVNVRSTSISASGTWRQMSRGYSVSSGLYPAQMWVRIS